MSQYIDYDQYQQIVQQQHSPRTNLFQQNRNLLNQLSSLKKQIQIVTEQADHLRIINDSLFNALKRVFSPQIVQQILNIIKEGKCSSQNISQTFYELMMSHQSLPSVSDWSESHQKLNFSRTPRKSTQRVPLSPISSAKYSNSFRSYRQDHTSRQNTEKLIATEIMCEICDETFGPVEFVSHAEKCKQLSFIEGDSLQDTQDRDIQKKKRQYEEMMGNLLSIRNEIEEQIKMLKFSKEKIDRAAEKRKLEKDLAKVVLIIKQKQGKMKEQNLIQSMKSGKLGKSKKMSSLKLKH